jgi:pheromone shutdown protein TraB
VIVFTLDPIIVIQLVLTVVMPILVGLVTTRTTSGAIKAWLLAGFTLVTSMLTQLGAALSNGTPFDVGLALLAFIPAFAISVATYYGLWKPTGIGGKAQDVDATTLVE